MDAIDPQFPKRGQQGWGPDWLRAVQDMEVATNGVANVWAAVAAALAPASPIARFTVSTSGLTASFDASTSSGSITSYAWTFGDGATGTGATTSRTYAADGTYDVTLIVTAASGQTSSTTQSVHVGVTAPTNVPPTASFTFTQGTGSDSYRINVTAVASSDPDGSIVNYHWNFGNGVLFDTTNPIANGFYYTAPGTYTVTLTVKDNVGATASAVRTITVKAPPPVAEFTFSPSNLSVAVDASPSTAPTGATLTSFGWNFGDTATAVPVYGMTLGGKVVTLSPLIGNMLQCAVKNTSTGNLYATQARNGSNGTTSPYETTQLSRMDATGALIDSMTLTDAGHGTSFALEYNGGKTYVWLTWQRAESGGKDWDIVRFPYPVGGGTFTRSAPPAGMTVPYPGGLTGGVSKTDVAAFDAANNRAVLRTVHSGSNTFQQVVLSDFLAGTITVLHTITLPDGPPSLQGYSTVKESLFRYTGTFGAAPSPSDPPLLTEYRWLDGAVVSTLDTSSLGRNPDGTYPGGRMEPESCTIYQSGTTLELWVGMITGTTGAYNYNLYRVPLTASTQTVTPKSATGKTASHTYAAAGSYPIQLTVTDSNGNVDTVTHTATVTAAPTNSAPSAAFTYTQGTGTDSFRLNVDASASSDPDGTIVGYHWDFGDGATYDTANPIANGFYYKAAGTYTVTLTVTDNAGATRSTSKTVTVTAPVVSSGYTQDTGGTGVQPTGTLYTSYQSLSGSFQTRANAAGTGKRLSLPAGTLATLNGFTTSNNYGALTGVAGVVGSGSAKTIVQQAAGSNTDTSNPTTGTNPRVLLRFSAPNFVASDFRLQGITTGNGLRYHAFMLTGTNPTVSRVKIVNAGPGNDKQPPGETFCGVNLFDSAHVGASGGTITDVEVDGAGYGASAMATNTWNGAGLVYTRCYVHDSPYSAAWALWQMTGGAKILSSTSDRCRAMFNIERCDGTIEIDDHRFGALYTKGASPVDFICETNVASGTYGAATMKVVVRRPRNPDNFPLTRKLTVQFIGAYGGGTQYYGRSNFKAYDANGVDITSSTFQFLNAGYN